MSGSLIASILGAVLVLAGIGLVIGGLVLFRVAEVRA